MGKGMFGRVSLGDLLEGRLWPMMRTARSISIFTIITVLMLGMTGCSGFLGAGTPKVKHYETSSDAASEEPEEVPQMSWEDALLLASEYEDGMTLEQKVGQIFVVNLEQLDDSNGDFYEHRKCTKRMKQSLSEYSVGGVILFTRNLHKRKQAKKMINALQRNSSLPLFVMVDEEGGRVARLAANPDLKTTRFPSAEEIGKTQDDVYAYEMGKTMGTEIRELGFNVDLAPVADVRTSRLNSEIGDRSFGDDEEKVAEYVSAFIQGLDWANISAAVKHFPGQGSSKGDTHETSVDIDSSIARLRKIDFVPFQAAIEAGADFVMVSHISVSKVTETETPASMSDLIMQTILREELGFEKVVITDAFDMTSITDYYTPGEAACASLKGGADIILMPQNLPEAYEAVLQAVKEDEELLNRLRDSVRRILALKLARGLLTEEMLKEPESTVSPESTVDTESTAEPKSTVDTESSTGSEGPVPTKAK